MKKLNIAIIGLGNIGSYLFKYLKKNRNILSKKNNCIPNITYLSAKRIKKKRGFSIKKKIWLRNYLDATKKKDVDLIVELIGGSEGPAKKLVFNALKNKKHVVTANKALKESLIANKIKKIYGIFNGTSNYILSSMQNENKNFNEVLEKAKKLGYAESNPSADLNGDDVASKLKILSSLCFNSFLNNDIHVEGINNIDKEDIDNVDKLGYKIKLLGVAELINNNIYQRVHPSLVKKNSYVASIDGVLNAVILDGYPVGQSIIQGEGAGPAATTSALVSDISSILRGNIKFPFSISNKERKKIRSKKITQRSFSSYLRFEVLDQRGVLSNITSIFSKNNVSIKRLIQTPKKNKGTSSIIIITHSCKDSSLNKVIKIIGIKNFIIKRPKMIRINDD